MLVLENTRQSLISKEHCNRPHREDESHTTILLNAANKGIRRSESQENVELELQYNLQQ